MQKILVIQTAFLGDVILATGILEKLHLHYPQASIDFLVRKGSEGLFTRHPFIRHVLVWDKQQHKYRNLLRLLLDIRREQYAVVINIQRFAATGILTAFSGAKRKIGFRKNPLSFLFDEQVPHTIGSADQPVHETDRNHQLIRHLTDEHPHLPRLYPSEKDYAAVQPLQQRPYIVIAPASVWYTKQLPAYKWVELIQALPAGYPVFLIGGPDDAPLADSIRGLCPQANVHNCCGQLSLLASAALQQGALMNYVNDSAPLHMASALNAPVTAVYCSTTPQWGFGPTSRHRFIVETEKPLPCRPCGLQGRKDCPQKHFECATTITVKQLLHTLPPA